MTDDASLPHASHQPAADLVEQLRTVAPQVFAEGKIDFDKLKASLGEYLEIGTERYGLNWAGKAEAFRNMQPPSVATLLPMPKESVDWDATENLIIEGDNLEVLKLLQKPYHGQVKMIYIDPPYNTGNEFIYPDNFREGLADYLRYSGQVGDDGQKRSTNTETSGRFHSNWLSMMYPRLLLARSLMREDGVIFVSIDDNEVHNLRMLMNEVFGEENLISAIIVQSNKRGQTYKDIAKTHEYILAFSKGDAPSLYELEKDADALPHKDSQGSFDLWELRNRNPKFGRFNRENLFFPVFVRPQVKDECGYSKVTLERVDAGAVEVFPRNSNGDDGCWRWSRDKILGYDLNIASPVLVAKQKRDGGWNIYEKSRKSTTKAKSLWDEADVISEQGTVQLGVLGMGNLFDHPKPVGLIAKCLKIATRDDDLVLDFFAGSGSTAQATLDLNNEDGCKRRFILVQLPERTDKADYPTIAHITRERVRRAIAKLASKGKTGFRAFKLSSSNFKIWNADKITRRAAEASEALTEQLKLYADNIEHTRGPQDKLYELMLKSGFPLSSKVEQIDVAGKPVWSVSEGKLLICLESPLTREVLQGIVALKPARMLCLDAAFAGNDSLKTNTLLDAKSQGVVFRTV